MRKSVLFKKTTSLLFSVLFVLSTISAIPFVAGAATKWTPIASSDFTQVAAQTNASLGVVPTYKGMGKTMSWSTGVYTQNGNASKSDDGAIYIPDGYMYLSGYEDGCVPINGCSKWKIDFGFRFKTDDSDSDNYENSDNYSFMKSYVYTDDLAAPAQKNNAYCHFSQNANGVIYSWENDGHNAGTQSWDTSITTNNNHLVKDTNYHYVAEYTGNYFRAYITDEAGKVVQEIAHSTDSTFLSRLGNSATVRINSFKIGDDDNQYYFKGLEYRNITFYSGDVSDSDPMPASNEDKYLFAYFTGNTDDGENLRYAVSSDGVNFAPLNRGVPVTTITVPDDAEGLDVYPTGTKTSAWSTGNIRDPYVFKAQDGSYYILATDLNTTLHGFVNNSKMLVWHLDDLKDIDTTTPWAIDVTGMFGAGWVYRAWAPQAIWDPAEEKYMLYFAEQDDVHSGTVMYYVYTSDFKTFSSEPKRLVNYNDKDNIDGDITYNPTDHLYYLWYKNENTSTLGYATSPNCCGPYTNTQTIQANDGLEGCQVHQLTDGTYILLADAYGAGYFKVYPSATLSGFSDSNILDSDINYLSPRHGSVVRITTAEYNRLVEKFGVRESTADLEYYFSEGRSWGSTNYTDGLRDASGETYTLGATGGYKTTSGTLELTNGNLFIQTEKARNIIKGSAFTLTFKHKLTEEYKYTQYYNMITVGNAEQDFIALAEDGTFYVGGTACPEKATTAYNVESEYTICFNGSTVSLLQNGEYVTGALFNKTISEASNGTLYIGLGWSDKTLGGRTTGTYRDFKLSPSATLTGHEDELLEEYLDNYDFDKVSAPAEFNAFAYHVTHVATGGYSNVVYSPQNTTVFSGNGDGNDTYVNIGRMNFKIATPRTMVLVYDGAHEVSYPVVVEQVRQQSSNQSQIIHYIGSNASIFELRNDWQGYTQTHTLWPLSNIVSSDDFAYYDNNNYNESTNLNNADNHFYSNRMIYNGSGDTDKYYEVANNDSYYVKNSYKDNLSSRQYKYGDIISYSTRYVINYAPVYKMLSGETKVPGTEMGIVDYYNNVVKGNEDKYTESSVKQFYVTMAAIIDSNPNNYSFSATLSDVETNAAAIKKAVAEFNKINLVEKADFTELNAAYEAADETLVELGNSSAKCYTDKVSALVNAVNNADMYRITDNEKENTAKALQSTIDSQAAAINLALDALHNDSGRADLTAYSEAVDIADSPDSDIYSVTKQDTGDILEAVCDIIAGDDVAYTSIGGDALSIPTVMISSDQSTVDIVTGAIVSYMTTSIREYTITLVGDADVSFTNNGSDTQLSEKVYKSTYNNTAVFNSESDDTAWYMEYTSETTQRGKQYQASGATYKTQVIGDITVYAVKRDLSSKQNKVTIVRDYMNDVYTVAQVDYVEDSFTLPEANALLGYDFVGYYIGATKVEGTVDITKDTTITAKYQKRASSGYSVIIYNTSGNNIYAKENDEYNTKVTVSDDGAYAWVERIQGTEDYRPFYIGSELSFFVSESIELKAVTKAQFDAYSFELPVINIRQSIARTECLEDGTKAYFNGQVVDDPTENAKILEYGYLVGKAVNRIPTEKELTLENSGEHDDYKIIRAKSTKRVGANQFTISVSKITNDIIYRGYIVYQVGGSNGEIKTVYTDCRTLDI